MFPKMPLQHSDVMHTPTPKNLYERTDYIANLDLTIQYAVMGGLVARQIDEAQRRSGLPLWDRAPIYTPLALHPNRIPDKGGR